MEDDNADRMSFGAERWIITATIYVESWKVLVLYSLLTRNRVVERRLVGAAWLSLSFENGSPTVITCIMDKSPLNYE